MSSSPPKELKPRVLSWLPALVLLCVLFAVAIILLVLKLPPRPGTFNLIGLGLAGAFVCVVFGRLVWTIPIRVSRWRIRDDGEVLRVPRRRGISEVAWTDIQAVWEEKDGRRKELVLATERGQIRFSSMAFELDEVLALLTHRLPAEAFTQEAREHAPAADEVGDAAARLRSMPEQVSLSPIAQRALGGLWMLGCLVGTTWALLSGSVLGGVVSAVLSLLGVVLIVTATRTTLDRSGVTVETMLRRYRMEWSDVREVETAGTSVRLLSHDGYLTLATEYWRGKARAAALDLLRAQIAGRELPTREGSSHYRLAKNTRVR